MDEKLNILKTQYKKQYNKYFKCMSYRIFSWEIDALYNILVLKIESEYEENRRWEQTVKRILNIEY